MGETYPNQSTHGVDDYDALAARREVKELSPDAVDFYAETFESVKSYVDLSPQDIVLDVGCNSGGYFVEAARNAGVRANCIGVDVIYDPNGLASSIDPKFFFINGSCEDMPLKDNTSTLTMAHNVLFRLRDVMRGLEEIKRVTVPDGIIALSTNSVLHSPLRYSMDRYATYVVAKRYQDRPSSDYLPPANRFLLENVEDITKESGGLEIIDYIEDKSTVLIHPGKELETFKKAIKSTALPRYNEHPEEFELYCQAADEIIDRDMKIEYALRWSQAEKDQPFDYFLTDQNYRGMYILKNLK